LKFYEEGKIQRSFTVDKGSTHADRDRITGAFIGDSIAVFINNSRFEVHYPQNFPGISSNVKIVNFLDAGSLYNPANYSIKRSEQKCGSTTESTYFFMTNTCRSPYTKNLEPREIAFKIFNSG
jgi:hypothetical protein